MKIKKIGAVVAMQKEIIPLLSKISTNVVKLKDKGYNAYKFNINNNHIYLIESGIGEIQAASATQLLISKYKCKIIINFGVCGALSSSFNLLKIVLVEKIVHYDFDLSQIDNCPIGKYPQFDDVYINCDKKMISLVKEIDPNIPSVICASADKFVSDENIKFSLMNKYNAQICEMESAGVALTSLNNGIRFIVLKAISDGKGGAEEFKKMVNRASEIYVNLIIKIMEKI